MRRAALPLFLPLLLALACDRTTTASPDASGGVANASPAADSDSDATVEDENAPAPLSPPSVDLGPADPQRTPLTSVDVVEYELPHQSRRFIRGKAGSGKKLPGKLGRSGELMVAIDSPYQLFARSSTYVHVAAWRPNGKPASGASVYVGPREVGRTDGTGTLVFRYDQPKDDEKVDWDLNSLTVVDSKGRCGAVEFSPYERTPSFASDSLFVSTDRGVYRPGETIHVRGIGWRLTDDYAPIEDATVEVQLRDAQGYTVAGGLPKTDEYGVLSVDLELPTTAREGLYELAVAYGQERSQARLQVRNFEVPAITIDHDLPRFITRDADSLDFELSLTLVTGEPLTKATLELSADDPDGDQLFTRELALSGPGPHAVQLSSEELSAILDATGENQFATIGMKVRDDAGREDELEREVRVSQNPYVAVLELDKDQYATGEPVSIAARITDRDRVPARDTPITVRVTANDGTQTNHNVRTDAKGTGAIEFPMPKGGGLVELHMPKIDAPVASAGLPWIASRPMQSKLDELVVRERETAKLVVRFPDGFRPAEDYVHVDVVDTSGALVNATLLAVGREQGEWVARGEFEAPTWGSMLLTLFALGRTDDNAKVQAGEFGLLTEGQNLVVQPDKELEITLKGFPTQAAPGETFSLEALVYDAEGAVVDASVGVSLVDASVLDLKDPLEITPMDRFYNPELRTLSTTGSKILTWPVVSRNWGGAQIDVALPPFPYLDGGGINSCADGVGYNSGIGYGMGSGAGFGGGGLAGSASGTKAKPSKSKSIALGEADGDYGSFDAAPMPEPMPEAKAGGGYAVPMDDYEEAEVASPQLDAAAGEARRPRAPTPVKTTTITVRTRLPEVALWSPTMEAKRGKLAFDATVPEAIGEQELILIASDERGGVGIHRQRVRVSQPVFVQPDLPAQLIAGETLELPVAVHNGTDARHEFLVELNGLGQPSSTKIGVAAKTQAGVGLPILVADPGQVDLRVRAAGGGHDDSEQRSLPVVGAGVPISERQHGTLAAKAPARFEFQVPHTANDATLRVRFPAISAAFMGLDAIQTTLRDDPDAVAVDLVSAALVLRWAKDTRQQSDQLDRLREQALAQLALLRLYQRDDGAYGYWRNGAASPYVTGWVLDGLLTAREAGLPDTGRTIALAAEYIVDNLDDQDGLVEVHDIGWWEGESKVVRLGLTAELYATLARLPKAEQSGTVKARLKTLDKRWLDYLSSGGQLDPLTAGRAVQGLLTRGKIDTKRAREVIRVLLQARDQDHWEPSWFHAYGGRIEVSSVLIEVMNETDPQAFAAEIRDTLAWVLSTRESWGVWHNERGTSAALRAILHAGLAPEERPSTVEVVLDSQVIERVTVDPADPFQSTLALAQLVAGRNLAPGKHAIELRYDGQLAPSVELDVRTWEAGSKPKAKATKRSLQTRASSSSLGIGGALDLRVELDLQSTKGGTLVLGASNLVEVDLARLSAWVGPGRDIRSIREHEGRIELELAPQAKQVTFEVPLRAVRRGSGQLPSVAWLPRASSQDDALVSAPGPIQVQ